MASRRCLNFDVLLEQDAEGRYTARFTDSPLGATPNVWFQLPSDATTLQNMLPGTRAAAVEFIRIVRVDLHCS